MVALYIHRNICPEIVRYPVRIPVGIKCSFRTCIIEPSYRQCDRPARAVCRIQRYAETVRKAVITDKRYIVWFVVVGGIISPC